MKQLLRRGGLVLCVGVLLAGPASGATLVAYYYANDNTPPISPTNAPYGWTASFPGDTNAVGIAFDTSQYSCWQINSSNQFDNLKYTHTVPDRTLTETNGFTLRWRLRIPVGGNLNAYGNRHREPNYGSGSYRFNYENGRDATRLVTQFFVSNSGERVVLTPVADPTDYHVWTVRFDGTARTTSQWVFVDYQLIAVTNAWLRTASDNPSWGNYANTGTGSADPYGNWNMFEFWDGMLPDPVEPRGSVVVIR